MSDHDPLCPRWDPTRESLMCVCPWVRAARADQVERDAVRVQALAMSHPRWLYKWGTHSANCWRHHPECALSRAIEIIREGERHESPIT